MIQSHCSNPAIPVLGLLKTANANCAEEASSRLNIKGLLTWDTSGKKLTAVGATWSPSAWPTLLDVRETILLASKVETSGVTIGLTDLGQLFQLFGKLQILRQHRTQAEYCTHHQGHDIIAQGLERQPTKLQNLISKKNKEQTSFTTGSHDTSFYLTQTARTLWSIHSKLLTLAYKILLYLYHLYKRAVHFILVHWHL